MTQKSAGRLLRDAAKVEAKRLNGVDQEKNTCWDDLEAIYQNAAGLLAGHQRLSLLSTDKELIGLIKDKVTLIGLLKSLAGDLTTMSSELTEIHNQHAGKTGGGADGDEVMSSITIYEQYHLFMERHDGVVMPTVYHVTELFEQAERERTAQRQAAASAAAVLDPTVTTDVEFKEVPTDVPAVAETSASATTQE